MSANNFNNSLFIRTATMASPKALCKSKKMLQNQEHILARNRNLTNKKWLKCSSSGGGAWDPDRNLNST